MSEKKSIPPRQTQGMKMKQVMAQRQEEQQGGLAPEGAPVKDSKRSRSIAPAQAPTATTAAAPVATVSAVPHEALEAFNTRLPTGLHRRLKLHAVTQNRKIQDVVHEALKAYLDRADQG